MNWPRMQLLAVWATIATVVVAQDDPAGTAWKFDVVRLKKGAEFHGLLVEKNSAFVKFINIRRNPGRPTVVLPTTFTRNEIENIEEISEEERGLLRAKLKNLESEQSAKNKLHQIQLEPCEWGGKAGAGLSYRSDYFILMSNASEADVRRAAMRLEQIYSAYRRYLSPRAVLARPTQIELVRSREEYAAGLKAEGRGFINTAFFDPQTNRIVCTGDMARVGDELEARRREIQKQRDEIAEREAKLSKLYKGEELGRLLQLLRAARTKLDKLERTNETILDQAADQLFAALFHEAFHAYLAGYVYPAGRPDLPRWLNEGLAQIFETAIVEAGELRLGHADRQRLGRAKEAVRKGGLVPISRLIRAGGPQFLAAHAGDLRPSDEHYLTAWVAAHYLMFERRLLGSTELDSYCRDLAAGADPEKAFRDLVGQPATVFDRDLTKYVSRLQPDGSLEAIR
jgi:hypothetical protein